MKPLDELNWFHELHLLADHVLTLAAQPHTTEGVARVAVGGLEDCYMATVGQLGFDPLAVANG